MTIRTKAELLDAIHEHGDPTTELRAELDHRYGDELKAMFEADLRKYPAARANLSTSDIYQSVIARLGKAKIFRPVESGTAVLRVKGRKRMRHHERKYRTDKRDVSREDRSPGARDGLAAASPSPSAVAASKETQAVVRRACESLSAADREILALHDAHGLTFAEVGARLGVSAAAATKRCAKARRRLRAILESRGV